MPLRLIRSRQKPGHVPPAAGAAQAPLATELPPATLAQARRGEAAGCRAFVSLYERRVFTFALRMLGDPSAAEDVAQDAFLRAFSALSRFDAAGPARLSTWLLTITHRLCLDELRRQRRHPNEALAHHADSLPTTAEAVGTGTDVGLTQRRWAAHAEQALLSLPAEQRAVFALRVLMEMSVADTAAALAVDEGTVKSRLSRAKTALRAHLGGLHE